MARPADWLDQAVTVEHGVDGALGWNAHVAGEPPDQELADLARPPMRLVALEVDDQAVDLRWQLVGIAHRPARAVAQLNHDDRHDARLPIAGGSVRNLS
jgi:hypothetical protein